MTRHQFSKTHLSAAMLALHATSGLTAKGDGPPPLPDDQEVLILDAARQINANMRCGFAQAEASIRAVLKGEQDRLHPQPVDVAKFVSEALEGMLRMYPPRPMVSPSPRRLNRGRYRGERRPITSYEHALVDRWPNALDGGRRAQNSGEFSILASKLGATDEEIVAMVAAINARPR